MSVQLQARGEGLAPVNTSCTSDSLSEFLERAGYTDIRVVVVKDTTKKVRPSEPSQPAPRRAPRVVTRRPRT